MSSWLFFFFLHEDSQTHQWSNIKNRCFGTSGTQWITQSLHTAGREKRWGCEEPETRGWGVDFPSIFLLFLLPTSGLFSVPSPSVSHPQSPFSNVHMCGYGVIHWSSCEGWHLQWKRTPRPRIAISSSSARRGRSWPLPHLCCTADWLWLWYSQCLFHRPSFVPEGHSWEGNS